MPSPPYFPSWSPDGKRLSLSVVDPQTSRPALWELNADGSNLHPRLAGWGGEPFDCNGTWTPNGKYFLFDSFRGGPDSIWAVRERGSWFERWSREPMRLSSGPMSAGKPVASKDGRRIFFLADTGKVSRLSRYDAKSGDWSPYLSGISAEQVDFSRDGQWVAYTSILGANLVRSRMDGSQRLQLTSPPVEAANPRWSPDGEKIALIGSNFGRKTNPGWYYNLKKNPQCTALVNGCTHTYLARETQNEERQKYWDMAVSLYGGYELYRIRAAHRQIPVMILEPVK